jgi:O-acetyl-ADP-ribose deacetylase (regulator of RNase III)
VAKIKYIVGDATRPQGSGLKIIVHCCNNVGAWGLGFVMAISKRWPRPEAEYKRWFAEHGPEKFGNMLGATQLVPVESDIWVANIVGQHGLRSAKDGTPPVRYEAITYGLNIVGQFAVDHPEREVSVHAPRFGTGLAGGSWDQIEPLIKECLLERKVPVTVYDLP